MSKKKPMDITIYVKRLRLKAGDILIVRDLRTAVALMDAGKYLSVKTDLDIPIIVAPEGVERANLNKLKAIVARAEGKS